MEITFIRHGQPDWEPDDRAVDEPVLTKLGREQAERAARALASEHGEGARAFDVLYVSPLVRAQETAAPIARALGLEPRTLSWLRELALPELGGSTPAQVQAFFRDGRLREPERWWDGYAGGESFRHFYERVTSGVDALLTGAHALGVHEDAGHRLWRVEDWNARVLVVAHEGTNAVAVSHLLGIEPNPWAPLRFTSAWTGMTRLHTSALGAGAVWSLEFFNRTEHLVPLRAPVDGRAPRSVL
ncbi:MAG: histidine phosphatase family protein [Myxococcota bacterium]